MRFLGLALLSLPILGDAAAQTLQTLVIGPDTAIAVAPRGVPLPPIGPAPVPLAAPMPVLVTPLPLAAPPPVNGGGILGALGLSGVPAAAVLAPLAAAALGGGLPGSGGGSSGPARTR